jgi:hypothetical protein
MHKVNLNGMPKEKPPFSRQQVVGYTVAVSRTMTLSIQAVLTITTSRQSFEIPCSETMALTACR